MYVIGHDHGAAEVYALVVLMEARIQYDETDMFGKNPMPISAESKEVSLRISLEMRKLAAVPTWLLRAFGAVVDEANPLHPATHPKDSVQVGGHISEALVRADTLTIHANRTFP